jgi:hypothetical protein
MYGMLGNRVKGYQFFAEMITGTAAATTTPYLFTSQAGGPNRLVGVQIRPGNSPTSSANLAIGAWQMPNPLQSLASIRGLWQIIGLKFKYVPSLGTSNNGFVTFSWYPGSNLESSMMTGLANVQQFECQVETPVWKACTFDVSKQIKYDRLLYVDARNTSLEDYVGGTLGAFTTFATDSTSIGRLFIEYDIFLAGVRPSPSSPSFMETAGAQGEEKSESKRPDASQPPPDGTEHKVGPSSEDNDEESNLDPPVLVRFPIRADEPDGTELSKLKSRLQAVRPCMVSK